MTQSNSGTRTFTATEAIGRRIRVKLGASGVSIGGAGEETIGTTVRSIASGGNASVRLDAATHEVTASGVIAMGGDCYSAAAGKVSATISGRRQGIAIQAGTDGNPMEMMPVGVNS